MQYLVNKINNMYEIKHPEQTTYWIAYTNTDIFSYGICTPEQQMYSGQPFLWTTLSEAEWLYQLKTEFNTIP